MKDKMYEPGSPGFKEAVRMPNYVQGMGGMLRKAAGTGGSRRERFKSPSRILSGEADDEEDSKEEEILHKGQMLRESGERKLKGYFYKLQNKDLYYYKKETDEKHKGMYALNNVFMRVEKAEPYDEDKQVYSFTLIFPVKERRFYSVDEASHLAWVKKIK